LVSYPKSSRTIQAIQWREERMSLVCAPSNQLALREQVRLSELNGHTMIGFDHGLTIRSEIDKALANQGAAADVVMEFDNIETIKRAIEIDAGIGLLPEPTVIREVQAGTLVAVPIEGETFVRPLGIIHRRGKELSATAQRFIELLQREGKKLSEDVQRETEATVDDGDDHHAVAAALSQSASASQGGRPSNGSRSESVKVRALAGE
jgi:DNA-binding transcriptional LysR family regulator